MSEFNWDGFEQDFWKLAGERKAWDEIIPGELRGTVPVTLTTEVIRKFAVGIGDPHPLYTDESYARSGPFGGIIAPPTIHIMLMFACTDEKDWMRSPGTINASQSWFYNVPARPGDTIRMVGKCLDRYIKKGRLFAIHENVYTNQKDEVVCSGRGWTIRPE